MTAPIRPRPRPRPVSVASLLMSGAYDADDPMFLMRHFARPDVSGVSVQPPTGPQGPAPATIGAPRTRTMLDAVAQRRAARAEQTRNVLGALLPIPEMVEPAIGATQLLATLGGGQDVANLVRAVSEGDAPGGLEAGLMTALAATPVGVPRRSAKAVRGLINQLTTDLAEKGFAGATLDPRTLRPIRHTGYLVGSTSKPIGPELTEAALEKAIGRTSRTNPHLGIWYDADSKLWFAEPSTGVETLEQAKKLGAQRKQIAVGHMEDGVYKGDIKLSHAPNPTVEGVANEYIQRSGITPAKLKPVKQVDEAAAKRMAQTYESLQNAPNDPAVQAAYRKFVDETRAQYDVIRESGFRFEFVNSDPYKNSAEMMKDVRENRRLKVFKTAPDQSHPLMSPEENDIFRAVHDYFGHARGGNQFGPLGEESAYRSHAAMYSPEARRAMATETRGQNSWVNYGRQAEGKAPKDRPFAEQKAALWPEDMTGEYSAIKSVQAPAAPTLSRATSSLLERARPSEVANLSKAGLRNVEELASTPGLLPTTGELVAATQAGADVVGGYADNARVIRQVFGDDAPIFGRVTAALSPKHLWKTAKREPNLEAAVDFMKEWESLGRPRVDAKTLQKMRKSINARRVAAGQPKLNVIPGPHFGNLTRAFNDPPGELLSGPKADSFWRNLLGDLDPGTLDTRMAQAFQWDQGLLQGNTRNIGGRKTSVASPGYVLGNALLGDVSSVLGIPRAEVQEGIWKAVGDAALQHHVGAAAMQPKQLRAIGSARPFHGILGQAPGPVGRELGTPDPAAFNLFLNRLRRVGEGDVFAGLAGLGVLPFAASQRQGAQ